MQALLPATNRADSMCSGVSLTDPRQSDESGDMTRQTSILHSLGTQPDEVALRVLAVRTDAVTGLPLDVYEEPPTARFRPPGQMLHKPGASRLDTCMLVVDSVHTGGVTQAHFSSGAQTCRRRR